jgi:thiol-disulfide isomerase/thioredoxin
VDSEEEDEQEARRRAISETLGALRAEREDAGDVSRSEGPARVLVGLLLFMAVAAGLFVAAEWFSDAAGRVEPAGASLSAMTDELASEPVQSPPRVLRAKEGQGNGRTAAWDRPPSDAAALDGELAAREAELAAREAELAARENEMARAREARQPAGRTPTRSTTREARRAPVPRRQGRVLWEEGANGFARSERRFREGSRPLLVYFYTDWCGYCAAIERDLWSDGAVAELLNGRFTAIRINPEDSAEDQVVAQNFRVRGYPRVYVKASPSSELVRLSVFSDRRTVHPDALVRTLSGYAEQAARR